MVTLGKQKGLERLLEIFGSLSQAELRYLKNYLTAFHNKGKNKALELVELMEAERNLSQDEYSRRLYGDPKSKAFIMLKGRLMEKILETLMLSVNFQNNPAYQEDPAAFESIDLLKNLTYAHLLRRRGLDHAAEEILRDCVQQATQLQLPEIKVQALAHLRNIATSEQEMWGMRRDIELGLRQYESDLMGVGYFDEFRALRAEKTSQEQSTIEYLQHNCKVLEDRLEEAYSTRAHYYYLLLRQYLHELLQESTELRRTAEEMIALLTANPGIGSKNRKGIPYLQLAMLDLKQANFAQTILSADQALSLFHEKKKNTLAASTCKLYACMYLGQLDDAEALIRKLDVFRQQKRLDQSTGIVIYLESCLAYLRGNTKQAIQILNSTTELLTDKEGWNVGIRTFEILLLIDQDKLDLVSARVENLRKHLARYQIDNRQQLIYRCLQSLERVSYSFSQLPPDFHKNFEQLQSREWSPLSDEFVRFEWWVAARMARKPYLEVQLSHTRSSLEVGEFEV